MSLDYGKMRSHVRLLKSLRRVIHEFKIFCAFSHFYFIHLLKREDWMCLMSTLVKDAPL